MTWAIGRSATSAATPGSRSTGPGFRRLGLRLGEHDAVADRQGFKLDGEAGAVAVRPGCADPRPDGFLAFAFPDAVGVQCGFLAHGCLLRMVKPHNGDSMRPVTARGLVS